jgi:hypothetical protein
MKREKRLSERIIPSIAAVKRGRKTKNLPRFSSCSIYQVEKTWIRKAMPETIKSIMAVMLSK